MSFVVTLSISFDTGRSRKNRSIFECRILSEKQEPLTTRNSNRFFRCPCEAEQIYDHTSKKRFTTYTSLILALLPSNTLLTAI